MNIIVFGTGDIAKSVLPLLKEKFNILFCVDNNEKKWNQKFIEYDVKSPDEINKHDCDVVIVSTKYNIEICHQLQQMGVDDKRIHFCRRVSSFGKLTYDIYPINENEIESKDVDLKSYDLLNRDETLTLSKKVMVFAAFYSTYTKQLIENMSSRYDDVEISLLTCSPESKDLIKADNLKHIYCFQTMADLKTILEKLPVYDVMQFLWIENEWVYFSELLRKKTKRLNLNVGGSDFYRVGKAGRDYKKTLVACADIVTAETEDTLRAFSKYYKEEIGNRTGLLPFGIGVLDCIDKVDVSQKDTIKQKYQIPNDKIIVTCGHNAIENHQHMKILEAVDKMSDEIKSKIVCVFPMTYPKEQDAYINLVESALVKAKINYVILKRFMDFYAMAEYACISDVMIHVQTTDQLSSAMLEEMYAESVVIAGKWLPYDSLHQKGVFFLDVNEIPEITHKLEEVVEHIETYQHRCKVNPEIIHQNYSWDAVASRWHELWQ